MLQIGSPAYKGAHYLINIFLLLFQRHDILEAINNVKTEELFFPESLSLCQVSRLRPLVLSIKVVYRCVWSIGGMIVQGKIKAMGEKSVPVPHCLQIPPLPVAYRREVGGVQPPPPKFLSFDNVEPDCKLSGKCLVFPFQHPN